MRRFGDFMVSDQMLVPTHDIPDQIWNMVKDVHKNFFADESGVHDKTTCLDALARCANDSMHAYDYDEHGCLRLAAFVYFVGVRDGISATVHGFARPDVRTPLYSRDVFPYMCDYMMDKHKLMRLESLVPCHNRAGKAILLRSGFEVEGTLRNYARFNGQPISYWLLSKIGG